MAGDSGWVEWSMAEESPGGWSHHGLCVLEDRTLVGYHPGDRQLLFFDAGGRLVRTAACDAVEAHDIAVAPGGLWIADCGHKLCVDGGGEIAPEPAMADAVGRVLLVDLDGRTLRSIDAVDHPAYAAGGSFLPTGVAVDDRGLWIADGYGSNLVHLVDHDGRVLLSLEGFDCPHGVLIDRRQSEPLLCIAERGARRICVYRLDGTLVRHLGVGVLLAPCAMATSGDNLLVADLVSRVTVFDVDGVLVEHLGGDRQAASREGFPNAVVDGMTVPPRPAAGRFNSPHGIAADGLGHAYVTEWLLGGRWVRLSV